MSSDIADWSKIADRYDITFAVTGIYRAGVACFTYLSRGTLALRGFEPAHLIGQPFSTIQTRDWGHLAVSAYFGQTTKSGDGTACLKNVRKDGTLFGVRVWGIRVPGGGSDADAGVTAPLFQGLE